MTAPLTEREAAAARRIEAFLRDEHIREAFERLERYAFDLFRTAHTAEEWEEAKVFIRGLDAVQQELHAIVERGRMGGAFAS